MNDADQRLSTLGTLMPTWVERRAEHSEAKAEAKRAAATAKGCAEQLARIERDMDHVASCKLIACVKCEEINLNGPA